MIPTVEETESWDTDDGSSGARASSALCLGIVWDIAEIALECVENEGARLELECRLALFQDMAQAECLGLPLAFGSKKVSRPKTKKKRKVAAKAKKGVDLPEAESERYWAQRHLYFRRYDQGIALDKESWYSVTPEKIAQRVAARIERRVVLDAFCGVGGNAIQFARQHNIALAIDCDMNKLKMAQHNARIYGVTLDLVLADATTILRKGLQPKFDLVFLSPPWGGPSYIDWGQYDPQQHIRLKPQSLQGPLVSKSYVDGLQLVQFAADLAPNLAYFLPKTTPLHTARTLTTVYLQSRTNHNNKSPHSKIQCCSRRSSFCSRTGPTPLDSAHAGSSIAQFEAHYLNEKLKAKTLFIFQRPDATSIAPLSFTKRNHTEEHPNDWKSRRSGLETSGSCLFFNFCSTRRCCSLQLNRYGGTR